ncbi:hypothetical protein ACHAWC_005238 [Mediolabrus comicus]
MSPSSTVGEEVGDSMPFDCIGDYRIIVASATLDELDRKPTDEINDEDVEPSVADTEHADNTHPYLTRYADIYAHSQEFDDDADITQNNNTATGATKFIKIGSDNEFKKGEVVMYHDEKTNSTYQATIVDIHYDERRQPHYDLMFKSSSIVNDDERNDINKEDTVRLSVKGGSIQQQPKALEAASEASSNLNDKSNTVKCVNFDINPTPFDDDDDKTDSHEEEAPDVPDDEKDELEQPKESDKKRLSPPRTLLAALLKAYPQATQSVDDQNLIPLHSAIRGNASLSVMQDLLEADPASVNCKDARGRNAHILAKKVYGRRSNSENNKAREWKYARLKVLLNLAGSHPQAKLKEEKQQYESRLNELENENLILRRDCVLLRSRCERNDYLLDKLVQKLQEYQQKMDAHADADGAAGGDQNFGNEEEMAETREEVRALLFEETEEAPPPPPPPAIKDDDVAENWRVAFDANSCKSYYFNKKTRIVTWIKPKCLEEGEEEKIDSDGISGGDEEVVVSEEIAKENKVLGGNGAYSKRKERHIQTTISYEKNDDMPTTPMSAKTGATEATTPSPDMWEERNRVLELESFDEEEEDKFNKPFMAGLGTIPAEEAVKDISSSAIFRLSSTNMKENVPFDIMGESSTSFTNAGAFSYADMVKVGDAEKPQEQVKVGIKANSPSKKGETENPAIAKEVERLRQKFSTDSKDLDEMKEQLVVE